jgi:hypothetical protein
MKKYIFISLLFASCEQPSTTITELFSLPKKLKEVSGILYTPEDQSVWAIEDSGNASALYKINATGTITKTISITDAQNTDWEDITMDKNGNLYLGDFGNNDNERKDLCIYKVDKNSLLNNTAAPVSKISFSYPEQKQFPPNKKELWYDVEGFFEMNNNFYLFTKNRSKGFDGTSLIYKIPNQAGNHTAILLGSFKTCDTYKSCAITSAILSPDQSVIALLTHDKIILFENFKGDNFLSGTQTVLELNHFSQKEAATFIDNDKILLADEKYDSDGGKVYKTSLTQLKTKS